MGETDNLQIKKSKLDKSGISEVLGGKENHNPNSISFGDSNYKDDPPIDEDISSFGIGGAEYSVPNKTQQEISARTYAVEHSNFANYS